LVSPLPAADAADDAAELDCDVALLVVGAVAVLDVDAVLAVGEVVVPLACAEPVTPAMSAAPKVVPAAATPAAAMEALRSTGLRRFGLGVFVMLTRLVASGSASCHASVKLTSSSCGRCLCPATSSQGDPNSRVT
jgi:hypothetical protein